MKLHLIRHAKTSPTAVSGHDYDRQLLPEGIMQASVLADHLKELGIKPVYTLCSKAQRTKETLSILIKKIDLGRITFTDDLYLCDFDVYLKLIWAQVHSEELMLIGHNDGISSLVNYLTEEPIHMQTSTYVCIEFDILSWKEVSKGLGKITHHFRPSISHLS